MFKLLRFFSYISLIIYPFAISSFLKRLRNYIHSFRFAILTGNKKRLFLEKPFFVYGHKYIKIGHSFNARSGFRIECIEKYEENTFTPQVCIGDNVSFNLNCHVGAINKIIIGNNVLIGSNVLITDHSHGNNSLSQIDIQPIKRPLYSKGPVIIEDNVWIGEGVCILPNVTIGQNSIIGANSVVTKDIPPYSIAGGNPAMVIKSLKK